MNFSARRVTLPAITPLYRQKQVGGGVYFLFFLQDLNGTLPFIHRLVCSFGTVGGVIHRHVTEHFIMVRFVGGFGNNGAAIFQSAAAVCARLVVSSLWKLLL